MVSPSWGVYWSLPRLCGKPTKNGIAEGGFMYHVRTVAVFCGASEGRADGYRRLAERVGEVLAEEGLELIYGGGDVGLMGAVARGALRKGGRVTGVLPRFMEGWVERMEGVTYVVVGGMAERKVFMEEKADGFVVLPGGIGTMDEFFEVYTLLQLEQHAKPVMLLNFQGFYDPLLSLIERMVEEGFLKASFRDLLCVSERPEDIHAVFSAWNPPRMRGTG
ncbi:hypothetical protein STHERM_c09720 [Spirochaeta thermophila DSM 6192]|uniref:Cytokinin riboside 5'-monophosphate phosphoribohydrolase n=2 Tax=Winmispira thermophila TaxID=154 RepID=E0RSD1_WINT6|nr:hypothetical protein STHERM_c09720 [Spirochaeta thermophila DSM 6192]